VKCDSSPNMGIAERLENAIIELLALQEVLSEEEVVDAQVLSDFRDALNRVRNTAWAAQKCVTSRMFDHEAAELPSFLAAERVRGAFQLCRSVHEDLKREEIEFQKGQLAELYAVVTQLSEQLKGRV
jgi:hypothetical protein